jgi:hypothetical protein
LEWTLRSAVASSKVFCSSFTISAFLLAMHEGLDFYASLMTNEWGIFSCFWPFVYILRNVFEDHFPFLNWFVFLLNSKNSLYIMDTRLIRCMIYVYFLSFCKLSFQFLYSTLDVQSF